MMPEMRKSALFIPVTRVGIRVAKREGTVFLGGISRSISE